MEKSVAFQDDCPYHLPEIGIFSSINLGFELDSESSVYDDRSLRRSFESDEQRLLNLVTWRSPNDPDNPRNWSAGRKWVTLCIVSMTLFITSSSSTIIAPALPEIRSDLNISSEAIAYLCVSIFILGGGMGSLVLGPLSELYGRVPVILASNIFFLLFNIGSGFATSSTQLVIFRLLSGLGASAPYSIGGGVMGDCFPADRRGLSLSIFSIAPLFGPAAGPIIGAFVTKYANWRWAFHAVSGIDIIILLVGSKFLKESWAPKVLQERKISLMQTTGNKELFLETDSPSRTARGLLKEALVRPFALLRTEPILQALALYLGFLDGVSFLVLSTFDSLWVQRYGLDAAEGSLHYIAIAVGYMLGCQVCAHSNDRIFQYFRKRNNSPGKPEYRCPMMIVGALFSPIGILIYGWGAQNRAYWLVPDLGGFLFAVGFDISTQSVATYVVDCYTRHAASAVSAVAVVRYTFGAVFPVFGPQIYARLDYGWGNTMLALIAICLGWPAPLLLLKFAAKLRARSKYAAISDAERETAGDCQLE